MELVQQKEPVLLACGDSRELLRSLPDNSVDAIITDPPYEIAFMSAKWDASGVAWDVGLWREAMRVLKPGGHLLAFAGSRTYHRMAVAIEDAGFEIRDQLLWLYGSGMPKSLNVSKAIDKAAGAERKVIHKGKAVKRMIPGADQNATGSWIKDNGREYVPTVTAPATPEAQQWEGWGTNLKPSHEPICMARKPLAKRTVVDNLLAYGTGAINIDACRVPYEDTPNAATNPLHRARTGCAGTGSDAGSSSFKLKPDGAEATAHEGGRWPANLIHDGSAEVVALFPAKAGGHSGVKGTEASAAGDGTIMNKRARVASEHHGDAGSAARFFYCAKTTAADRHDGMDVDPGPQLPHGATLRDAENLPKVGNHHPTVKPTAVMRWLVRLVTPPGGVVLDLFMGSGSTGRAARLEGARFIGFELSPEYVEISRRRIAAAERAAVAEREAAEAAQKAAEAAQAAMPTQLPLIA